MKALYNSSHLFIFVINMNKKIIALSFILTIMILSPIIFVIENQPLPEPKIVSISNREVFPVKVMEILHITVNDLEIPKSIRITPTQNNVVLIDNWINVYEWKIGENYTVGMEAYIVGHTYIYDNGYSEVNPVFIFTSIGKAFSFIKH